MDIIIGLAFWLALFTAYFLPTIIAKHRRHHNQSAILVTNLLLGWTGAIWLIALIWAFTSQPKSARLQLPE